MNGTAPNRVCRLLACAILQVRAKGVEYVPFAVLLAGVLQLVAGKARVGKYIRIVPHPVCARVCVYVWVRVIHRHSFESR